MIRYGTTCYRSASFDFCLSLTILAAFALAQRSFVAQDQPIEGSKTNPGAAARYAAPLEVIHRMDRNADGILDLEEIPPGAEDFVLHMADEAQIDPGKPFNLVEFSTAWLESAARKQLAELAADPARSYRTELSGSSIAWASIGQSALAEAAVREVMQMDPELELLARMDLNHDGVVRPAEIPPNAEIFVGELLQEDGFPPHRAVSLKLLAHRRQSRRRDVQEGEPRDRRAKDEPRIDSAASRKQATSLIRLYDSNQDGALDTAEWTRLSPSWRRADRNRNGRLSVNEVSAHLMSIRRAGAGVRSTAAEPTGDPLGLLRKDANKDGQIQLSEFATVWTDARIAEFHALDLDEDGVLTPKEIRLAKPH